MTSLNRVNVFFESAVAPVMGLVALANMGCATTIAGKYPHLDRRAVCVLPLEIEPDSTEFVITDNNVPISNFHPEMVDRVAAEARTVFEYDPNADPSSTQYLPAPYNQLTCPERFSPLPSSDTMTRQLPTASVDLLVHEPRPEIVPRAITEKLASCPSPSSDKLKPIEHTMSFNVYVTNDGKAVSALGVQSTLGDRKTEACLVNVLRGTSWPVVASEPAVAAAPAPLASKLFVADGPTNLPDMTDLWKQIQKGPTPSVEPPSSKPGGLRLPTYIVTLPLRLIVGTGVFVTISLWPRNTAPRCADELNPITHRPFTSIDECNEVLRLSPDEIARLQQAVIKATGPQAPPAPAPQPQPPAPVPECPRNEHFIPRETHNATGCFTKKGDLQCYSRRHYPCAGVHTHGIFTYQKMDGGKCVEIKEPDAVRCEGPFIIKGPCGSVSTTTCGKEGTATSGIYLKEKRLDTP